MIQMRNCTQDTSDLSSIEFWPLSAIGLNDYDSNEKLH